MTWMAFHVVKWQALAGTVEVSGLVGTKMPDVTLQAGFPDPLVNMPERVVRSLVFEIRTGLTLQLPLISTFRRLPQ